MQFRFTPEQQSFRKEVQDFLRDNLPPEPEGPVDDRLRGEMGWSPEFSLKLAERHWVAGGEGDQGHFSVVVDLRQA